MAHTPSRQTAVALVLGVLLLTAAGLKLYGLRVDAVARVGWLSAPWVQAASVQWEIALGAWLLSRKYPLGSWLAAVGTFAALAAVSLSLGWAGQASCGCLGVIPASPWHALAADLVALGLLAFGRPDLGSLRREAGAELRRLALVMLGLTVGGAAVLGAVGVGATWTFGSTGAALARLRGESLAVPAYLDLGAGEPGQALQSELTVTNWAPRPVRLIGGTADCSCLLTAGLPLTIPPGESRSVPVTLRVPASRPGTLTRTIELWTDYDGQRTIRLTVGCRVGTSEDGFGP